MTGLEALKIVEKDCEDLEQVPYGEMATIEKSLKALEIIKKKTVDIWLIQNKKTLKQYNSMVDESRQLTEEEFELLKGILNDE